MIFKKSLQKNFLFLFISLNTACSSHHLGFSEEKINDRIFKVSFEVKKDTIDKDEADEEANRFFLHRCAEIALDHHFPYFEIIDIDIKTKKLKEVNEAYPLTKARVSALSFSGKAGYFPKIQQTVYKSIIKGIIKLSNVSEKEFNIYKAEEILKTLK